MIEFNHKYIKAIELSHKYIRVIKFEHKNIKAIELSHIKYKRIELDQKSAGMAGVSSGGGLGDGLLVCSSVLLR